MHAAEASVVPSSGAVLSGFMGGADAPQLGSVFQAALLCTVTELANHVKLAGVCGRYELSPEAISSSNNALRETKQQMRDAFADQQSKRSQYTQYQKRVYRNEIGERGFNPCPALLLRAEKSLVEQVHHHEHDHAHDHGDGHSHAPKAKGKHTHNHEGGCNHDDSTFFYFDGDELVHGMYAVVKDTVENPAELVKTFEEKSSDLDTQPFQFLAKELAESGVGEFAAAMSSGAAMLPFAGLAIHAGVGEMKHASHTLHDLHTERHVLESDAKVAHFAAEQTKLAEVENQSHILQSRLDLNQKAKVQAKNTWIVGFNSAASGFAIGLKAISDIALKVSLGIKGALNGKGFFALGDTIQAGTAAAGAAVGFGIAGTFVLGPLAGVFATALGAFFTIKTMNKRNQLKQDFKLAQADLKEESLQMRAQGVEEPHHAQFVEFMERQGDKRISFFTKFGRWNKAFMVGSGLYAASAVTKAVVVGVALAGIGAAVSNPIGLAVITAVGVIGAVGMGVASLSFIRGHAKQNKYSKHTNADHQLVDRHFLASLRLPKKAADYVGEGDDVGQQARQLANLAFDTGSACLKQLNVRKSGLRQFLNIAAGHVGKISPYDKGLTVWARLRGKTLGLKTLQPYLTSEEGKAALKTLVIDDLDAQAEYLQTKLAARDVLVKGTLNGELGDEVSVDGLDSYAQVLGTLDADYEKDQAALEHVLFLSKRCNQNMDSALLGMVMKSWGVEQEHGATQEASLAKHLLKDMDKDSRLARGVLFESQLQGSRLKDDQYKAQMA